MTNPVIYGVVHFIHGSSRATPCEKAYLDAGYGRTLQFSIEPRKVTCPLCLEHPICLDAMAEDMEKILEQRRAT